MSGNSAEEASFFVPQDIRTDEDLLAWIRLVYPLFEEDDVAKLLYHYPSSNGSVTSDKPVRFATAGDEGMTALDVSTSATGQQQRANNIYAESTFVCPSYWLAEAYNSDDRRGYKYQYSVTPALHGSDTAAYFGPPASYHGPDFAFAFQKIWGNFIIDSTPSISNSISIGARANQSRMSGLEDWPVFASRDRRMVNLNQTGGIVTELPASPGASFNVSSYVDPGLRNNFRVVDGYEWEGGRGSRCDYWKSVWSIVPH